jgi:hypothetical protein
MLPNIFITASIEMRDLFKRYGKSVTFDLTYHLIKEKIKDSHGRIRSFGFGYFGGLSASNKIICFAVAILNDETS